MIKSALAFTQFCRIWRIAFAEILPGRLGPAMIRMALMCLLLGVFVNISLGHQDLVIGPTAYG
jgi:hypothetical protein